MGTTIETRITSTQAKDAIYKAHNGGLLTTEQTATLKTIKTLTESSSANEYVTYSTGNRGANAAWITKNYENIDTNEEFYASATVTGDITALAVYYGSTGNYLGYEHRGSGTITETIADYKLTVPIDTTKISITGRVSGASPSLKATSTRDNIATDVDALISLSSKWKGKNVVWFGTSIPAGSSTNNYPLYCSQALGFNLFNESVPSSAARIGLQSLVSGSDPYGWGTMGWSAPALAFSATIAEKQYLIDNWDYWKTKLTGTPPTTLSDSQKTAMFDASWENKLNRHLGVNRKDLYVFDHGYNDHWGSEIKTIPTDMYDRTTYIGAMNYLIDKILQDNPKAAICIIGHYENKIKSDVSLAQTILSEIYNFPFLKLWTKLGWTQKTFLVGGVSKTLTQIWMPDNVHPHSDTSGSANWKIANYISSFLMNEVR